jgi:CheW-like domain
MHIDHLDEAAATAPTHDPRDAHDAVDTTPHAPARLLEFDWNRHIALPVHTTIELIEQPEITPVPGAAYYTIGMLRWQGRHLAVLDLCTLLNAHTKAGAPRLRHALVVAYQTAPRGPVRHAAIATIGLPQTVRVGDAAQCPLPGDGDLWPLLAVSCFMHQGHRVPIVDTGRLFGSYWG